MNSTDEFLKALKLITPIKTVELEYRLHYNEQGDIYMCTMQQHPDNTEYVVVTKEEYYRYSDYRVENKKLKLIDKGPVYRVQLLKSDSGFCVVKDHASLLLESDEEYPNTEYYGTAN